MMRFFRRLVREQPLGTVGGIIVLLLLLCGIFADVLAPYPKFNRLGCILLQVNELADLSLASGTTFVSKLVNRITLRRFS